MRHLVYAERPDVEVYLDGAWWPGELRMWTQRDDGAWWAQVSWRKEPGDDLPRHHPGRAGAARVTLTAVAGQQVPVLPSERRQGFMLTQRPDQCAARHGVAYPITHGEAYLVMLSESTIRRQFARQGLALHKLRESHRDYRQHGPYMVIDASTTGLVRSGVTLDEVEAMLVE